MIGLLVVFGGLSGLCYLGAVFGTAFRLAEWANDKWNVSEFFVAWATIMFFVCIIPAAVIAQVSA